MRRSVFGVVAAMLLSLVGSGADGQNASQLGGQPSLPPPKPATGAIAPAVPPAPSPPKTHALVGSAGAPSAGGADQNGMKPGGSKPNAAKQTASTAKPGSKHARTAATARKPSAGLSKKPVEPSAPPSPVPAPQPAAAEVPPEPGKGSVTGLPLPRYAALRSEDVNLRMGPGTRYPIDWVYHRRDLPVEIEREFEVWRLVTDPDGTKGWVHQATLTGRRSFEVRDSERTLRSEPRADADAVAKLKPGVVGRIRTCRADSDWCEVQVGDYRGFLKRDEFWGAAPGEAIN